MIHLVANWKTAPDKQNLALALFQKTAALGAKYKKALEVTVCAPALYTAKLAQQKNKNVVLAAQHVAPSVAVAQTGLLNAAQLADSGVKRCLVGHSECRARGDSNEAVAEMVVRLLEQKIQPIVCIGEKERDAQGWYLSVIKEQIESVIAVVPKVALKQLMFAYEPVWAIGKQAVREATAVECQEIIIYIRKLLADLLGEKNSAAIPVLYGGSVNENNALSFITEGGANGLLVGRVSLDAKAFATLAKVIAVVPEKAIATKKVATKKTVSKSTAKVVKKAVKSTAKDSTKKAKKTTKK